MSADREKLLADIMTVHSPLAHRLSISLSLSLFISLYLSLSLFISLYLSLSLSLSLSLETNKSDCPLRVPCRESLNLPRKEGSAYRAPEGRSDVSVTNTTHPSFSTISENAYSMYVTVGKSSRA